MASRADFLSQVLERPRYGFVRDGRFYRPSSLELLSEFFFRINVVRTRKNWLPLLGWVVVVALGGFLALFVARYFSWTRLMIGFVYSMVALGTHGTIYLHRYSTHRAFRFRNKLWRFCCQNLVIKIVPEEVYVVSHHVHHHLSDEAGDPYNPHGGWLYCFLADVNHQLIARDLSESDYLRTTRMLSHTGVIPNSYEAYQRWGSICHPGRSALSYGLNWAFWYVGFWVLGGPGLATALFGMSAVWAVGIRTFNFEAHGRGQDRHRVGVDYNLGDLSINQLWPGFVAGEWHNNHHLYPRGARSGFLLYQLDLAWVCIWLMQSVGGVTSCRDYRDRFLAEHRKRQTEVREPGRYVS